MKSQHQNFQKHLNGNYSNQEAISYANATVPLTEEVLNQDNRICYKKRREELNRRVKSIVKQKKQAANARN